MTTDPRWARAHRRFPAAPPLILALALALAGAITLAACGSSTGSTDTAADTTAPSEAPTSQAPTETTTPETTTAETTAPETTAPETTAVEESGTLIEAAYTGGEVVVANERIDVELGSEVEIVVESDVAEHVHLHGYDIFADVAPGTLGQITFTADVPGVFEVELEDSGLFLFEIAVS